MNFRLTIGLLIVLVALAGTVYFVESNPATPTPAAKTAPVLTFLSNEVTALEVNGEGKTVLVARGDENRWLLRKPEEASADQIRVDSLVSRLGNLTATRTVDAPSGLAEFGLEKPAVEAKVTLKSGQTSSLLLGERTPDKTSYYAKLPGAQTVYLIPVAVGGDLARLLADPPKATPTPAAPTVVPGSIGTPSPEAGRPSGAVASPTIVAPLPTLPVPGTPHPEATPTPKP